MFFLSSRSRTIVRTFLSLFCSYLLGLKRRGLFRRFVMIPGLGARRRSTSRQHHHQQPEESRGNRSSRQHYHYHSHQHYHHHHHPSRQRTTDQHSGGDGSSSSSSITNDPRPCRTRRFFQMLQRQSESDAHRVALEARTRLDERLRDAAFVGRRNVHNSLPRLAHNYFNALFSDEDDSLFDSDLGLSLRDWFGGQVQSFRETWQPEWMADSTSSSGLSKAAMSSLPKEVYSMPKSHDCSDCSVCLETFSNGQTLLRLPCKHRFHLSCLTPWLEHHDQCPYCRAVVTSEKISASSAGEDNLLSWLEAFETGMSGLRFRLS